MKAAVRSRYGPPSIVRIAEVPAPVPGAAEILIKVHATTVNRTDCGYRSGTPFILRFSPARRSTILGTEFAGTVTDVGADVTSFTVGDRVFGYNEGPFGCHAQYLTIRASASVATIPSDVSFESAAAATEGAHYALGFLDAAGVKAGHDVLVNGATGAIGSAAVQLLKSRGANVTAVCAAEHMAVVDGLGADRVINYTVTDFTQDRHSYHAVLDAVGKSTFGRCKRLLKPDGVYASSDLGPMAQNLLLPLTTRIFGDKRVVFPFPRHNQEMIENFATMLETGTFAPLIDRRYPLDRIAEAYQYVETGQKIGNVIITVPD